MKSALAGLSLASHDDAHLVDALMNGDEQAFIGLVRREHGSMLRYARLFVSTEATAEEVVQEAWARMLSGLTRFESRSSLRTWLFGILANCARSRGVAEARCEGIGDDAVECDRFRADSSRWMRAPEPWPEERLATAEVLEVIRGAIDRLPGVRREVIQLRDVEGWNAGEVCALLGITEANQRVLLHRARSGVRSELERHFRN